MRIRKICAISVLLIIIIIGCLWYFDFFQDTKEVVDGTLVKMNDYFKYSI